MGIFERLTTLAIEGGVVTIDAMGPRPRHVLAPAPRLLRLRAKYRYLRINSRSSGLGYPALLKFIRRTL